MIRSRRPSARDVDALLASQAPHSYAEVGRSDALDDPEVRHALASDGYVVDVRAFPLGRGRALFLRAVAALSAWRHFEIPWLELLHAGPVATGQVVATLVRAPGAWLLNPCRVVYARLDPQRDAAAFAYGTLRGHALRGEERFRVWLDPASGEVNYEIAAFSQPAQWLTRLGRPAVRRLQWRFQRASAAALAKAAS